MEFLDGRATASAISRLLQSSKRVRAAVAYWGKAAVESLKIDAIAEGKLQVICDLRSGGCNPTEIKQLQKILGTTSVRTCDGLHAKVWLAEDRAIVGSSNASASGLGFEGAEMGSQIEANVLIDDRQTLETLETWFEGIMPRVRNINDRDYEQARLRWGLRRLHRPIANAPNSKTYSLLDVLVHNPDSFADREFFVWAWEQGENTPPAKKQLTKERSDRNDRSLECWENVEKDLPHPPGSHVLEFDTAGGRAKFTGLYKVSSENPEVKYHGGTLLLCTPTTAYEGMPIGRRLIWEKAATKACKSSTRSNEWCGPIDEFAKKFF